MGSRYRGSDSQMRGLSTRLHLNPAGMPLRARPWRARWSWVPRNRPALRSSTVMKGPHGESDRPVCSAPWRVSRRGPAAHVTCAGVSVACRGSGGIVGSPAATSAGS
eukprot:1779370-Alexandrium_andersonii.AAC.1